MDLEMLREVVPMLRQQLEKSMLDRNYVQLERVGIIRMYGSALPVIIIYRRCRTLYNNILTSLDEKFASSSLR